VNNYKIFPVVCIVALGFLSFSCDLLPNGPLNENTTKEFTITYEPNGGSAVTQHTVEKDGKIAKPSDPTKADYTFLGWFKESSLKTAWNFDTDLVTNDITLYAKWGKIEDLLTATFESNGGSAVSPQSVEAGSKIIKPADPTKNDHTFQGWYKESSLTTAWNFDTDLVSTAITLYAKWVKTVVQFTVTFESNGGSAVAPALVESGEKVIKPTDPTKAGNTFQGWYKEATLVTAWDFTTDTVSQNITLYAKWASAGLFLHFNPNGGTGSIDSIQYTPGETKQLAFMDSQITRTGYKFISWNTVPDRAGGTEYMQQANVTLTDASITLYAQWVKLYNLGDPGPAGGLVFYSKNLDSTWSYPNWVYMEAAPASTESVEKWGPWALDVNTPIDLGKGLENTQTLTAASTETDAAHHCANLVSGGYDDWFLPSRTELIWMAENLHKQGLGDFNDTDYSGGYWSSSIKSGSKEYAYMVIFNLSIYTDENVLGSALNSRRNESDFHVRAARRF